MSTDLPETWTSAAENTLTAILEPWLNADMRARLGTTGPLRTQMRLAATCVVRDVKPLIEAAERQRIRQYLSPLKLRILAEFFDKHDRECANCGSGSTEVQDELRAAANHLDEPDAYAPRGDDVEH